MNELATQQYPLNFSYAYGKPSGSASFKSSPKDFQVYENLGFDPAGEGEHIFLEITKRDTNTEWLARQLARSVGIEPKDVGYCGLKDRNAITSQWFSLYHPKATSVDLHSLNIEGVMVNRITRHTHKLRRGQHASNQFVITLRDLSEFDETLERIKNIERGVPNYFGPQRFGIEGGNLILADKILVHRQKIKNRQSKFMAISSARSYLFNAVLSQRIQLDNWKDLLNGDPSESPSGPLWGRGRPLSSEHTLEIESDVLARYEQWVSGLEHVGLSQERRSLVCLPQGLTSEGDSQALTIQFALHPGQFATSVLREVTGLSEPSSSRVD